MKFFLNDILLRSIFKSLYKLLHRKKFHHNRRYWPYYKVERDYEGRLKKVFYKKKLVVLNEICEFPENNDCMIVATGPSVKSMDKELFQKRNVDYIGLNGAISLEGAEFKYYVIIDFDFINNRFDLVDKILKRSNCTLFTTAHCLEIILRNRPLHYIKCSFKIIETVTNKQLKRFLGIKRLIDDNEPFCLKKDSTYFSTSLFYAVYDYYTVAYVALQIAYALNYKRVFIAGMDMNQFEKPRFYESNENKQPTNLTENFDKISHYINVAADFMSDNNIEVYNLSIHSSINAFKKITTQDFLSLIDDKKLFKQN